MSLFFDGVPDPNKPKTEIKKTNAVRQDSLNASVNIANAAPKGSKHPPFSEHKCEKCHDQDRMGKLIKPLPDLCLSCHVSFVGKFAFIHGPVAAGNCTECHSPHGSENKFLLTRVNEKVCFKCHNSEDVMKNKIHEGIAISECTKCHNPHGGKDQFMSN